MVVALLELLYVCAIVVGIIIATLLFKKQHNALSNKICAAYILCMLIPLWNGYISHNDVLAPLAFGHLNLLYPWLFGPLIYFYCRALLSQPVSITKSAMHLLPIPLVYGLFWVSRLKPEVLSFTDFLLVYKLVFFPLIFIYCFVTIRLVRNKLSQLETYYASINPQANHWLLLLLYGFFVMFLLDLLLIGMNLANVENARWLVDVFYIGESLYIVGLGFLALKQPKILIDPIVERHKYKHSSLQASNAERLAAVLEQQMTESKWYLDSDITLLGVAKKLNVAPHHLSQVLSENYDQSFYEFINRKRIDDAKKLLLRDDEIHNILDIAYEVGFNNKTSFNSAFKRFTNLTPSQFRKVAIP